MRVLVSVISFFSYGRELSLCLKSFCFVFEELGGYMLLIIKCFVEI